LGKNKYLGESMFNFWPFRNKTFRYLTLDLPANCSFGDMEMHLNAHADRDRTLISAVNMHTMNGKIIRLIFQEEV
jgi:hypothetical protein